MPAPPAASLRLALAALLCACAGDPIAGVPAPLERVAVYPLNVVVALPAEVEGGVDPVSAALRSDLEARGLEVDAIDFAAARQAWLESASALQASGDAERPDFDGAAGTLARRLAEARRFDALILPWLVVGSAPMKRGGFARWDGVMRKIRIDPMEGARRAAWASKFWNERFSGAVPAASLEVAVFSAGGEKLCQRAGGLDLIVEVVFEVEGRGIYFDLRPKGVVLGDPEHLREGIELAFGSCLPGAARAAG